MSDPQFPRWAINDVSETILDENNEPQILQNKLELSDALMDNGWLLDGMPARQEMNQILFSICSFLNTPQPILKAALPAAYGNLARMFFLTDVDGGVIAISDGTNWRKISLGANIV